LSHLTSHKLVIPADIYDQSRLNQATVLPGTAWSRRVVPGMTVDVTDFDKKPLGTATVHLVIVGPLERTAETLGDLLHPRWTSVPVPGLTTTILFSMETTK